MAGASTTPTLVSQSGRTYHLLPGQETLIGSVGCAITINEPGVQPRHARVFVDQGMFYIEELGGRVLINGQQINGRTILNNGDRIRVGSAELIVQGIPLRPVNRPTPPNLAGNQTPFQQQPLLPRAQTPAVQPPFSPIGTQLTPNPGNIPAPINPILPVQHVSYGQPQLQGQVMVVDGPHMEEPDFNLLLFLAKVTLWLFFFPILIWKPSLVSLLLFNCKDTRVPARYIRVRDNLNQETVVRMKGELTCGSINMGDLISVWGQFDRGTLQMERAFNHTVNAEVRLRR